MRGGSVPVDSACHRELARYKAAGIGIGGLSLIGVIDRDGDVACSFNGVGRNRGCDDLVGDFVGDAGVEGGRRAWRC